MKKCTAVLLAITLVSLPAIAEEDNEEDIAIDKIPKVILDAAKKAVPGIKISEAEIERKESGDVYEVEGYANGKEHELHFTADGKLIPSQESEDQDQDTEQDDD